MTFYLLSEEDADPYCGSHPIAIFDTKDKAEVVYYRQKEYRRNRLVIDELELNELSEDTRKSFGLQ